MSDISGISSLILKSPVKSWQVAMVSLSQINHHKIFDFESIDTRHIRKKEKKEGHLADLLFDLLSMLIKRMIMKYLLSTNLWYTRALRAVHKKKRKKARTVQQQ